MPPFAPEDEREPALIEQHAKLERELENLRDRADDGAAERRANLEAAMERIDRQLSEGRDMRAQRSRLADLADDPRHHDVAPEFHTRRPGTVRGEDVHDLTTVRASVGDPEAIARELRDRALVAAERSEFPGSDRHRAQERIDEIIRGDGSGRIAEHILRAGGETYSRGFLKTLANAPLSQAETRALSIGTATAGGLAVPYDLDPTVIGTSDLAVNPMRNISRVVTTDGQHLAGREQRGRRRRL